MSKNKSAYATAGVDIDAKANALERAKAKIKGTFTAGCVGDWGNFGGLFKSPGNDQLLVSSCDGVGTKLKVAVMANRHDTVGQCIVNHCVNDILVQGARPLFFLDYIGMSKLEEKMMAELIEGLCKACKENDCALIGGETAELPALYPEGEYDLVGTIIGAVAKKDLITGEEISAGDVLIGVPSSGLHTNGYSLARRVCFDIAKLGVNDNLPGTDQTVAEALLAVHRSYLKHFLALQKKVKILGMSHITGGGFEDNVPRVLPQNVDAVIDRKSWTPPALFQFIQKTGKVETDEMYHVFNMGIGMIFVVKREQVMPAMEVLRGMGEQPVPIGNIQRGKGVCRLVN